MKKSRGSQREKHVGQHVRLQEWLLASAAWRSLDGNTKALYIELSRRYRGPNSNNGKIPYSVREAATALHIGRSTAQRCFEALLERGFVLIGKVSGFNMKGRVATEWLLTEFPNDTLATANFATKNFMAWRPEKSFHSPTTEPHSPTTEPRVVSIRDRVAIGQR